MHKMPCFKKGQLSLSNFSGRNNFKISNISIKTFSIYCLYWDSKIPEKMVLEIALEIILQSLKVILSVRNKNSENSENPEITPINHHRRHL